MLKKSIIFCSAVLLMGAMHVSVPAYAEWIRYRTGDGQVPKGDCLEMMCSSGVCIEDSNNDFFGKCCETEGKVNQSCEGDECCQSGLECKNGVCKEKCVGLYNGQGNTTGCCYPNQALVPNPERGNKGWLFRGYKDGTNDYYGCCASDRNAGNNCCESGEKVCSTNCCTSSQNCCTNTCCSAACNAAGTACCTPRDFGSQSTYLIGTDECYHWTENTEYFVDSQQDMELEIAIGWLLEIDHIKVIDKTTGTVLNQESQTFPHPIKESNSFDRSITLQAGHTYKIDVDFTNCCVAHCSITAKCQ